MRLVDKRSPPGLANVCQPREVVQAISGRRHDEFEDLEDNFGGDIVNEALRFLELGLTRMSGYDAILTCGLVLLTGAAFTGTCISTVANGFWKARPTLKFNSETPVSGWGENWLREGGVGEGLKYATALRELVV